MENIGGEEVGVIVARLQVPELHKGHRFIFDYVLRLHRNVLVILGSSPIMTERNPLSFEMRRDMLEKTYPGKLTIFASDASPASYEERSRQVDEIIREAFPKREAVIYGSRDSFIYTYSGGYLTQEVPTVFSGSATEVREGIGIIDSVDFRAGVIYANVHRKRTSYPAVDVIVRHHQWRSQVLLVGKNAEEGKLRFPGVFFDPELDESFESAGLRCIRKELPDIEIEGMEILRSRKLNDWRFRKSQTGIVSTLLTTQYRSGGSTPGRGVDSAKWVGVDQLQRLLVDSHQPLIEGLRLY